MVLVLLLFALLSLANAATKVIYIDGSGDSLSVGYNAVRNGLPSTSSGESGILNCPNAGMAGRSFGAELASTVCPLNSSNLVNSFSEQQNCAGSFGIGMTAANTALSGTTMLGNFASQCTTIASNLAKAKAGPRQVLVFMGHNDICGGGINKVTTTCNNTDLDQNNYCRTSTGAFEREFRNGLEKLIPNQNTTISVLAPGRVSQLCRVRNSTMCQTALYFPNGNSCANAWKSALLGSGICASLTNDCSDARVQDAYNYEKAYVDILEGVSSEYESMDVGQPSKSFTYNGKTVGGAVKAAGVNFAFSNAIWVSQLNAPDLSCCDCFHASIKGQQRLADAAFLGVNCTQANPCCTDGKGALADGQCTTSVITDGTYFKGVQL